MTKQHVAAALAAALAVPAVLTGCAGIPDDTIRQTLSAAVVAEVPHATHALVNVNYDGSPANRGVGVKVFLDQATPNDVSVAVEGVLEIAWSRFPVEPVRVSVIVVDGSYSSGDSYSDMNGVDLNDTAAALGLGSSDYDQLTVQGSDLKERYGPWKEPSGQ